jgi:hypothetical protein
MWLEMQNNEKRPQKGKGMWYHVFVAKETN